MTVTSYEDPNVAFKGRSLRIAVLSILTSLATMKRALLAVICLSTLVGVVLGAIHEFNDAKIHEMANSAVHAVNSFTGFPKSYEVPSPAVRRHKTSFLGGVYVYASLHQPLQSAACQVRRPSAA